MAVLHDRAELPHWKTYFESEIFMTTVGCNSFWDQVYPLLTERPNLEDIREYFGLSSSHRIISLIFEFQIIFVFTIKQHMVKKNYLYWSRARITQNHSLNCLY